MNETEVLLNGIHTLDLAIKSCKDPADVIDLWMRKHTLLECLYKLRYKFDILNDYT